LQELKNDDFYSGHTNDAVRGADMLQGSAASIADVPLEFHLNLC
jgi:hypothetical protein